MNDPYEAFGKKLYGDSPVDDKLYYTPQEVAALFRTSTDTVLRWIKAGRIKATRPGGPNGHLRISKFQLDKLKEEEDNG